MCDLQQLHTQQRMVQEREWSWDLYIEELSQEYHTQLQSQRPE